MRSASLQAAAEAASARLHCNLTNLAPHRTARRASKAKELLLLQTANSAFSSALSEFPPPSQTRTKVYFTYYVYF